MRLSLGQTVLSVYALVFVASATLSAAVYWQGQAAVAATSRLVDEDIPTLRTLGELKADVAALEPIAYQYYVGQDRDAFLRHRQATERRIEQGLGAIRAAFPHDPRPAGIEQHYAPIKALADRLDEALSARPADREQARSLLMGITELCMDSN